MEWNVIQYSGWIIGIISSVYAIYLRKKLFRLQSKTEKAKQKFYRTKTQAEEARKADHTTNALKNFFDLFGGKKQGQSDNTSGFA